MCATSICFFKADIPRLLHSHLLSLTTVQIFACAFFFVAIMQSMFNFKSPIIDLGSAMATTRRQRLVTVLWVNIRRRYSASQNSKNVFSQTINRSNFATHRERRFNDAATLSYAHSATRMTHDKDRNCIFWLQGNSRLPTIRFIWDRINFQWISRDTIFWPLSAFTVTFRFAITFRLSHSNCCVFSSILM